MRKFFLWVVFPGFAVTDSLGLCSLSTIYRACESRALSGLQLAHVYRCFSAIASYLAYTYPA